MATPTKILFPIDITHLHTESIASLNKLIPLSGSQVHLLYVREELPAAENLLRTLGGAEELEKRIDAKANSTFDAVEAELSKLGAGVTREIAGGPAAMTIENVAKDEGFDLIVMPPGSKMSAEKHILGRVSTKVVHHARGTVLLLRSTESQQDLDNIVIGIDGSPGSFEAMKKAAQLFCVAPNNAKITLVNVVSVHPIFKMISPVEYISAIEGNLEMSGNTVLAEAEEVLSQLGIKNVEMKQVEGNPADCLTKVAKEIKASLIVVGAQGKGMMEHFLMGSTSTRLANQSECSVAVVRSNGKNA